MIRIPQSKCVLTLVLTAAVLYICAVVLYEIIVLPQYYQRAKEKQRQNQFATSLHTEDSGLCLSTYTNIGEVKQM